MIITSIINVPLIIFTFLFVAFLLFKSKNNNETVIPEKVMYKIIRMLIVVPVGFMYATAFAISTMATDSCRVGNPCVGLDAALSGGGMYLVVSLIVGVLFRAFDPVRFSDLKARYWWLVVFSPFFAIPVYFLIIYSGLVLK